MENSYESIFSVDFVEYIQLLKAAGRSIRNHQVVFRKLDMFLKQNTVSNRVLDECTIIQWLNSLEGTTANKLSYIARYRGFARYLRSVGVYAYEPEYPRSSHTYVPYVFSDEEWRRMIQSVDSLPTGNSESSVLFCIFIRLLYGCGLRKSEALKMETRDIDLENGILFVRYAKNDKQRYVPMDESLTSILKAYLSITIPKSHLFVNPDTGKCFSSSWADKRMRHLLKECNITVEKTRRNERGPCLHCFRHTFVANSFNQLLQNSLGFEDVAPFISAYLGHSDLRETDNYLQANYEFYRRDQELIMNYTKTLNIFPEVLDE